MESARQSALGAADCGRQTAHGGAGGVYEENVDDRLRSIETPETVRSGLAVTVAS